MKIIFLDVNGVLDSFDNNKKNNDDRHHFDPNCLENLKYLVDYTDAYIVVSSDWKRNNKAMNNLFQVLEKYELDYRVLGTTPIIEVTNDHFTHADRGLEIKTYLENNPCDSFVILDDIIWDLDELSDNLVLTNPRVGLTMEDVKKAINILSRNKIK